MFAIKDKIARPQESQSFTAYTISKEQYDSWDENEFLWNFDTIKRTNTLNRLEMLWNA